MIACPVCLTSVLYARTERGRAGIPMHHCSCQRLAFKSTQTSSGLLSWTFKMDSRTFLLLNDQGKLLTWQNKVVREVSPEDAERTVSHAVRVAKIAEVMES